MKSKKVDRFSHAGKNGFEKEAYKNFLASRLFLDKTEKDPVDSSKTNESSFDEDGPEPIKIIKKSRLLKVKDFLYDNWVISIISGVLFLILGGYIAMYHEQGIQGNQISTIKDDVEKLDLYKQKNDEGFLSLKENFDIFKTSISKDLEYIKKKIKL